MAVCPNHFLVRQLNSPRNLIVHSGSTSPPRTSINAQSSCQTAFLLSKSARSGQPSILLGPYGFVKCVRATFVNCSDRLNSKLDTSFRCREGTPILATSTRSASGRKLKLPVDYFRLTIAIFTRSNQSEIVNSPSEIVKLQCSVMDSNHQPSD